MLNQKDKIGQKGAWPRSRDLLFKFWDPLISLERLKIQTSNFAYRLTLRDTIPKMKNWSKGGGWPMSRDLLSNFGTSEGTSLKFCTWIEGKGPYTEQNSAILVKRSRDLDHVPHLGSVTFYMNRLSKLSEMVKFDFQHSCRMWTWFVDFLDEKSKY